MTLLEKMTDYELTRINKLGFFLGSFDPLHSGHIEVIKIILEQRLCDCVFVYCVQGESSWKRRSDFFERTKMCEMKLCNIPNLIISYLSPYEIQQKLTAKNGKDNFVTGKHHITSIIGADIAYSLEYKNGNPKIEESRLMRQKDFMRGIPLALSYKDSIACSIALPADDFIVALRDEFSSEDIPRQICGRKIKAVIDTNIYRDISSSKIRENRKYMLNS